MGDRLVRINTLEELNKQLSANSTRAFFIHGDNGFLKREACKAIISNAIVGEKNEFSLIKFDDKNMSCEEIISACETAPFVCPSKCILVTDPPFVQMTDSDLESIVSLIQDVPEFSTLVFYYIADDLDLKKAKTSKIVDAFKKYGCEVFFSNKDSKNNARDFVNQTVKSNGCSISSSDACLIVEKSGGDFEKMHNEITKLCQYKQKGTINTEDIERLFSLYLSSTVFELTKFIFAGNYEGALNKLNLLKMQKEEPTAILAELSSSFIDHYRALVGKNSQKNLEDLKNDFSYRSNVHFRIENAYRASTKYRDVFLEKCLDLIIKADVEIKSTSADKYLVIERLITSIFILKEGIGT